MASKFSVDSPAVPPGTSVVGFRVREALSEPFLLEVGLRTNGARIDLDSVIGEAFHLEATRGGLLGSLVTAPHVWNGIIAAMELVHDDGAVAFWRATVTPKLWKLKNAYHSRVFTVGTVPEIVEAVLLDEGLNPRDFRFELRGNYPSLDHVGMFRESSFDFVSRLLEREGITYFFEHDDDRHVMVLVDDLGAHAEARDGVPMIPYADDDVSSKEGFFEFSYEHRALPSEVRVTDYDYLRPSAAISANAAIQRRRTGVIVEHAEFVALPDEERRYAELRSEEISCREQLFQGWGRVAGLRAGFTFAVSGHQLSRLDDEYLAIELDTEGFELEGDQAKWLASMFGLTGRRGVIVNVTGIPKSVQFRPERVTPWPRIHGIVDGVIDGMAASSYAQIDAQGRYKVRLRFDESDLLDGQASTWIRMLQPHGGANEGWHFPLRKGTEVQVAFLGGDPDRPMIVAAAPNAIEQSKVRSANHSRNVIHTGGNNTITMEDVGGGQYITTFSPPQASTLHLGAGANQVHLRTDGQGHVHTGGSHDIDIHANKIETVAGTLRETYGGVLTLTVTGAVTRTMSTSLTQTVTGPVTEHVTAALTETVGASVIETYNTGQTTTVTAGVLQNYNATLAHTVNASPLTEDITASRLRLISSTLDHHTTGHADETFGSTIRLVGGDYTETVNGTYTVNAPSVEVICTEDSWVDSTLDVIDGAHGLISSNVEMLQPLKIQITGLTDSITGVSLGLYGEVYNKSLLSFTLTGASAWAAGVAQSKFGLMQLTKGGRIVAAGLILYL